MLYVDILAFDRSFRRRLKAHCLIDTAANNDIFVVFFSRRCVYFWLLIYWLGAAIAVYEGRGTVSEKSPSLPLSAAVQRRDVPRRMLHARRLTADASCRGCWRDQWRRSNESEFESVAVTFVKYAAITRCADDVRRIILSRIRHRCRCQFSRHPIGCSRG